MNFRTLCAIAALIFSCCVYAGQTPFRTREPLPWNLLDNGGFERDGAGLFAVGQGQRDRENPASGDASGRFEIGAGQTGLVLNISSGLRLEKGKDYVVAGRIRTGFKANESEASVQAFLMSNTGAVSRSYSAQRLRGTTAWQMFVLRLSGDGVSSLKLSLNAKGQPGEAVWLDDLFVGPAHVEVAWDATPGSGLFQAAIADGTQFEFPIPPQSHVMGVFRNGKRSFETKDCEILYGANVVRFFETPARGEHISVVLRSTLARAQLPASPLYRYALYEKAGKADAWLPDAIEDFKAPGVDYMVLQREITELPSIEGLPVEWSAESPREIALKVHAAGRYSIRLRDEKRRLAASLADFVPLPAEGTLQAKFNGCDDSGVPLPPGNYVWDVEQRPLNAFPQLDAKPVEQFVGGVWRSPEGWMQMRLRVVNGRPAQVLSLTDDKLKEGERKAVIPTAQVDAVIQARPGVFFYFNTELGQVFKLENGTASVFPKAEITEKGQTVVLASYETPDGPGLFVSRSGGTGAIAPAVLKLDAKGGAVVGFGDGGRVGAPVLEAPGAIAPLEDGGALVADSRSGVWLKRLGPDGSALKVWSAPHRAGLNDAAWVENSSDAYATFRRTYSARGTGGLARKARQMMIAPTGEIIIATLDAGEDGYEVQIYSPRGQFIHALGGGAQQMLALETPGYPRLWDTTGNANIRATNVSLDARGDLFVFDRSTERLTRWAFAPRISNLAMTIKSSAKPEDLARVIPSSLALQELQQRHGFKTKAVDFADLAESAAGHGLRDDGTSSIVRPEKLQPYRLSGAEHGSWFRAQLQGAEPGKAHLLLIEYPDDAQRATAVSLSYEGEATPVRSRSSTGYATGGAYPLSMQNRYYTLFFHPRTPTLNVTFRSVLRNYVGGPLNALTGAAASRVWLLEIDGTLPPNAIEEPLAGAKRAILEHREDGEALVDTFGIGAEADVKKQLALAAQNSATLIAFIGLNGADVEAPATNARDATGVDIAQAELSAPATAGDLFFTYYGLKGMPRDQPVLKDLGLVNEYGHVDSNNLSLVYPEVQQYFRETLATFAQQGIASQRFKGLTLCLDTHAPPLFGVPGTISAGYEAASLTAFEAASKKTIPGDTLQEKIMHLKTTLREEFSAWRCGVVRDWVLTLRDALKKVRPDLQLRLCATNDPDLRFYGFDRALFANADGVRVIETPPESEGLHVTLGDGRARWDGLKPGESVDTLELRQGASGGIIPNREHCLAPLVAALVRYNPREILLQAPGRSTAGWDLEFREFVRAFRSLPASPAEELKGAGTLKVYRFGGKGAVQYLAVVNSSAAEIKETVRVADANAQTARDLVNGRDLPAATDGRGIGFDVSVPAESIRTYRLGK